MQVKLSSLFFYQTDTNMRMIDCIFESCPGFWSIGLNLLKMHQFAIVVTNNTDESINWASQDTLEEICKRPLDHVINEQLNNLSLPFSWSLSEPSLFSSAGEYQKLLETCRDAGTVIHALTGKGLSINDVRRFLTLSPLASDFYLLMSNFWGLFQTPILPLKSDINHN